MLHCCLNMCLTEDELQPKSTVGENIPRSSSEQPHTSSTEPAENPDAGNDADKGEGNGRYNPSVTTLTKSMFVCFAD